jgi:hypothetical protein
VQERERELERREMASLNGEEVLGGSRVSFVLERRIVEIVTGERSVEWWSVEADEKEDWVAEGCGGFFLEGVEKREGPS